MAMRNRPLFACLFALTLLHFPDSAYGQFTDAHTYDNTPVGTNQIELGYARVRADASIDASLVVEGARLTLNQALIDYTRYFGLFHRLMWVEAGVPYANLSGTITGTDISGSTTGTGDSSYQVGILLKGGPALSAAQFDEYKPATRLGLSLTTTAPTGSYDSNKLLNLGSDRWSFKPEFALSCPFGSEQKWQFDGYANIYFFTDNTSFHGREVLRQDPLSGVEGHLSYTFNDNLWLSLDSRYSFRGSTVVDGIGQNDAQRNFILGTEVSAAINSRNSLLFEFAKALVHENAPAIVGFAVKYDYAWSKAAK
jgi:hypothetical protein